MNAESTLFVFPLQKRRKKIYFYLFFCLVAVSKYYLHQKKKIVWKIIETEKDFIKTKGSSGNIIIYLLAGFIFCIGFYFGNSGHEH